MHYSERWAMMVGEWAKATPTSPRFWFERIRADDRIDVVSEIMAVLAGRRPHFTVEHRLLHRDGSYRWVLARGVVWRAVSGRPLRLAGWLTDITAIKHLESELRASRRFEAIGRLSAGVAHDLSNLLQVIQGHCESAAVSPTIDAGLQADVEIIGRASRRASSLTRQMLGLSPPDAPRKQHHNVNDLIVEVEPMLRSILGDSVRLVTKLAPKLWHVYGDDVQLDRVLINLVVNARDHGQRDRSQARRGRGRPQRTRRRHDLFDLLPPVARVGASGLNSLGTAFPTRRRCYWPRRPDFTEVAFGFTAGGGTFGDRTFSSDAGTTGVLPRCVEKSGIWRGPFFFIETSPFVVRMFPIPGAG